MEEQQKNDQEDFRNHIATVDEQGKRVFIYPKKPSGRFYNARTYLSYLLLFLLFAGPFLRIHGQPVLLLNVLKRKFIIFGVAFWPQDFHLFALSLITFFVFIILFTVVFGRLFCGWVCPQTIFLEMLFRKIEYFIDGDANKQKKLASQPWNAEKIRKRVLKHSIFYALSFLIGNTFLAYIIGSDELLKIISEPPSQHMSGLVAMMIFSFIFYGVFSWFREQACVMVCPYGRLQGVLLDQNSICVSYDFKRGEPRGKNKKDEKLGDCIDCSYCVQVCPTGIDIRNGTQLECVNCTACIDACDTMMSKLKRPLGLIRYSSYNGILNGQGLKVTPRVIGYVVVLTILLTIVISLLLNRVPIETTILRTPGVLFQEVENNYIQNLYNIRIINKSYKKRMISLKIKNNQNAILKIATGKQIFVPKDDLVESVFFVKIPKSKIKHSSIPLEIDVFSNDKFMETMKTSFKSPVQIDKDTDEEEDEEDER